MALADGGEDLVEFSEHRQYLHGEAHLFLKCLFLLGMITFFDSFVNLKFDKNLYLL
jgi:hypothetical protein